MKRRVSTRRLISLGLFLAVLLSASACSSREQATTSGTDATSTSVTEPAIIADNMIKAADLPGIERIGYIGNYISVGKGDSFVFAGTADGSGVYKQSSSVAFTVDANSGEITGTLVCGAEIVRIKTTENGYIFFAGEKIIATDFDLNVTKEIPDRYINDESTSGYDVSDDLSRVSILTGGEIFIGDVATGDLLYEWDMNYKYTESEYATCVYLHMRGIPVFVGGSSDTIVMSTIQNIYPGSLGSQAGGNYGYTIITLDGEIECSFVCLGAGNAFEGIDSQFPYNPGASGFCYLSETNGDPDRWMVCNNMDIISQINTDFGFYFNPLEGEVYKIQQVYYLNAETCFVLSYALKSALPQASLSVLRAYEDEDARPTITAIASFDKGSAAPVSLSENGDVLMGYFEQSKPISLYIIKAQNTGGDK